MGRRKSSNNCIQLEELVLDVGLTLGSLPDSTADGRRRRASTGTAANLDAAVVATVPKRTPPGLAPTPRLVRKSNDERRKAPLRRSRIDKSHLQINSRRISSKSTALNEVAYGNSPGLTADLTPHDQVEDETLGMYFDLMKQKSDFRRQMLERDGPDLFASASQCAQTVFAPAQSVVSGVITVSTEPALRSSKSRTKKKGSKEDKDNKKRNENTAKLPRRVYAQLDFEQGGADVKYWKLRSGDSDEKTVRTGEEGPEGSIQPHQPHIPPTRTRTKLQSYLSFKGVSCSAA